MKADKMPSSIIPEKATLVAEAPNGEQWLHEIKFDGYRIITFVRDGKIHLITRGQQDWTNKFPHLVAAIKKFKLNNAILDGEIVVLDKKQKSSFQLLQNSIQEDKDKAIVYYVFDLLYSQNKDLRDTSLLERKSRLKKLFSKISNRTVRYSDHVIGSGEKIFKSACKLGLEGIISKKMNSYYEQRRTKDWLKIKCTNRQEFVVGGFTKPKGSRSYFGSLLIGVRQKNTKKLIYSGHVGTGFNEASLKQMWDLLKKYKTPEIPFTQNPPKVSGVAWVKPKIVIEVEFSEWTQEGIIRHPSFKSIRKDKSAKEVVMEKPKSL